MTITNTGTRAGAEVPQVYLAAPAAAGEPPKQLKGYQKVFLNPGQAATVTVPLDSRAFAQWDTTNHTWLITPGTYQILVGSSSRDIRVQSSLAMPAKTLAP
jgi:beta-glucosidase